MAIFKSAALSRARRRSGRAVTCVPRRAPFLVGCLLGAAFTLTAGNALAVTFTVDSTDDLVDDNPVDGVCHTAADTCTLRAAVMQANRATGAGTTIVLPTGVYNLVLPGTGDDGDSSGDLNLTTPTNGDPYIHLTGAGASSTIIDANQIDRVLHVGGRAVAITNLTLRNGFDISFDGGGGILNDAGGRVTLDHVVISGNSARNGGGINNVGTLIATDTSLLDNVASASGSLNVGGGVLNSGDLTVIGCAIASNASGYGGGLSTSGRLVMVNSTVASNTATATAGGIYATDDATPEHSSNIYSSTIVDNHADADHDGDGTGGGLFIYGTSPFNTHFYNSILAGNFAGDAAQDCTGTIFNHGRNLFGTTSGCNIIVTDGDFQLLDSLTTLGNVADNGGPTMTVALLPGNNAIDGTIFGVGCVGPTSVLLTDQRGYARSDGACDIGAFEVGSGDADLIFADGFE